MTLQGLLFATIIILIIVLLLFAVLDRLIKSSPQKNIEKTTPKVSKETPIVPIEVPKNDNPPVMKVYNNELADELNEIIKKNNNEDKRLQIDNHLNKKSNIANYIQNKKYSTFNFDSETIPNDENTDEEVSSFTKEDYKRIMAFSNIDDKKTL